MTHFKPSYAPEYVDLSEQTFEARGEMTFCEIMPPPPDEGLIVKPASHEERDYPITGRVVSAGPDSGYQVGQVVLIGLARVNFFPAAHRASLALVPGSSILAVLDGPLHAVEAWADDEERAAPRILTPVLGNA